MEIFATRLRLFVRSLGLSDAEAARRAGLSERRFHNYLAGRREPDLTTLLRICRSLGATPNLLLAFEEGADGEATSSSAAPLLAALASAPPEVTSLLADLIGVVLRHHRERKPTVADDESK